MAEIKLMDICDTPEKQELGMKFKTVMPKEEGLLFRWQSPRVLSFWMKDTYLPLDIAFVDSNNKIVKTEKMVPLSTRSVSSGSPCVMALEVLSGALEQHGISVGDEISFDKEKMVLRTTRPT